VANSSSSCFILCTEGALLEKGKPKAAILEAILYVDRPFYMQALAYYLKTDRVRYLIDEGKRAMYPLLSPFENHRIRNEDLAEGDKRDLYEFTGIHVRNRPPEKKWVARGKALWRELQRRNLQGFFLVLGQDSNALEPSDAMVLEDCFVHYALKIAKSNHPKGELDIYALQNQWIPISLPEPGGEAYLIPWVYRP
jgi:hypothetical protein